MNAIATIEPGSTQQLPVAHRRAWPLRFLRGVLWFSLGLGLLTLMLTVLVSLAVPAAWTNLGDGVNITINGDRVELGRLAAAHALAIGAAMALAVTLVLAIVCTVVPMALLVAAGAVTVGLGIALLSVLGVAAVAMSPVLAVGGLIWFVWWLARR